MKSLSEFEQADQSNWNRLAPLHAQSAFYDVQGFKAGRLSLLPIEGEPTLQTIEAGLAQARDAHCDAVVAIDEQYRLLMANEPAAELLGFDAQDRPGCGCGSDSPAVTGDGS